MFGNAFQVVDTLVEEKFKYLDFCDKVTHTTHAQRRWPSSNNTYVVASFFPQEYQRQLQCDLYHEELVKEADVCDNIINPHRHPHPHRQTDRHILHAGKWFEPRSISCLFSAVKDSSLDSEDYYHSGS